MQEFTPEQARNRRVEGKEIIRAPDKASNEAISTMYIEWMKSRHMKSVSGAQLGTTPRRYLIHFTAHRGL